MKNLKQQYRSRIKCQRRYLSDIYPNVRSRTYKHFSTKPEKSYFFLHEIECKGYPIKLRAARGRSLANSRDDYRFRPDCSGQQAVKQVHNIIKTGRRFAVDVDLSKFFDRVNHDLLMTYLGVHVKDKRLLKLIKRYLRAGVIDNQLYSESREGVPQGGP